MDILISISYFYVCLHFNHFNFNLLLENLDLFEKMFTHALNTETALNLLTSKEDDNCTKLPSFDPKNGDVYVFYTKINKTNGII